MATLEEIQQPIADKVRRYETFITEILHSDSGYVSSICNYILANRGKQMRPLLVLLSAALHGEIGTRSYLGASLVEMLHTASLIHDDVVDEAFVPRRSMPCGARTRPCSSATTFSPAPTMSAWSRGATTCSPKRPVRYTR